MRDTHRSAVDLAGVSVAHFGWLGGSRRRGRLTTMTTRLTGTGIWNSTLRYGDAGEAAALAAELEELGYSALWIPDIGGDVFGPISNLLGATTLEALELVLDPFRRELRPMHLPLKKKSPRGLRLRGLRNTAGSDLLSHTVSHTVPSAVAGLTSVFGMGTGVTLLL